MNFNNISGLLEKFRNLKPSDAFIKEAFIGIVHEQQNITLDPKEVSVQKDVLYITTHPAIKSELNIHKGEILERLNAKLEKHRIKNII